MKTNNQKSIPPAGGHLGEILFRLKIGCFSETANFAEASSKNGWAAISSRTTDSFANRCGAASLRDSKNGPSQRFRPLVSLVTPQDIIFKKTTRSTATAKGGCYDLS